jgi:hypothetical protein
MRRRRRLQCQVGDAVRGIGRGNGYPVGGGGGAPPPLPPGMVAPAIGRRKSWQMLPAPAPADRRVFVGGLSRQMDETALHQFLSQWGQVADVKIIYDSKRISKGCVPFPRRRCDGVVVRVWRCCSRCCPRVFTFPGTIFLRHQCKEDTQGRWLVLGGGGGCVTLGTVS